MDPQLEAKERTREWLKDTYRKELGREAKEEGIQYWMDDIYKRGGNQNQVLSNIRRSDEKWLGDTFKAELGRELGEEGREYWMGDFRGKGSGLEDLNYGQDDRPVQSREQVLANIKLSPEYAAYQRGKGENPPPIVKPPIHGDPGPKPKPEKPKYDYTPDPDRKYNKYWDAIDAAADTGNRMTDDYYGRFLPQMRNEVLLGINEIGAADRYHGERYEGKPPTYTDPKELFDYYKGKTGKDKDTDSELEKRVKALEDKYSI